MKNLFSVGNTTGYKVQYKVLICMYINWTPLAVKEGNSWDGKSLQDGLES